MWVKICANTCLEDAKAAADLGADALGFVFAESKRRVTAEQVAAIAPHLPSGVERVGVFAGHSAEEIAAAVRLAGLSAVQLHGGFDAEFTGRLREQLSAGTRIIETISWSVEQAGQAERVGSELARIVARTPNEEGPPWVLVDAQVGRASGGLGVSFDWNEARGVFTEFAPGVRLVLAGGLRPDTVGEAIRILKPWGVDVASGVEAQPGRKDLVKVKEFLRVARGGG